MWDRFTERAKRVVNTAREEAIRLGSEYVRTEHILLGICKVPDSTAARILEILGAYIKAISMRIEESMPEAGIPSSDDIISFTPRVKKALQLAVEEAYWLNHNYVGTEHILLGLLKEGEGIAAKVLQDACIDLGRAETEIRRLLGDPDPNESEEVAAKVLEDAHLDLGRARPEVRSLLGNLEPPGMLLDIARGFMASRVLLTGAELGIFTLLAGILMTAEEVAEKLGMELRGVTILLDALTALKALEKREGLYVCPSGVSPFLSSNSPTSVAPMLLHLNGLWGRWSGLSELVRTGKAPEAPPGLFEKSGEMEAFIGAMHAIGARTAKSLAPVIGANGATNLLDVGGATGTYAEALLRTFPGMRATIFDRPPVIELARKRLEPTGLLDRITLVGGNFYTDELPGGHDLALLSAIIHQNSPAQNTELYGKVYRALVPGGRIVIRDHVMRPDRIEPASGAMFAVNMLVATPGGNVYTLDEIRETLEQAGFGRVRLVRAGEMDRLGRLSGE